MEIDIGAPAPVAHAAATGAAFCPGQPHKGPKFHRAACSARGAVRKFIVNLGSNRRPAGVYQVLGDAKSALRVSHPQSARRRQAEWSIPLPDPTVTPIRHQIWRASTG